MRKRSATARSRRVLRAVLRAVKLLSTPGWLALHVLALAVAVTMILLGRWQLDVSNEKHFNWQNFGYSLQWWAFAGFVLFFWARLMRDACSPPKQDNSGQLMVRAGSSGQLNAITRGTLADLVKPDGDSGDLKLVYRGYVTARSEQAPHRSDGDSYHASYNDYLWQLAQADRAERPRQTPPAQSPAQSPPPADPSALS